MKKYSIISNKKRNELLERVIKNGESVSRVSKQLRMKLPSAKSIIRTFKKSGKVFDKKRYISRKLNNKKAEISETDHQSDLSSIIEEKKREKVVKEESS
jgi:hypothetical protein